MKRHVRVLMGAILAGLFASDAMAGDAEIAAVTAALRPGSVDVSLFTPEFLKAVPPAQLQATLDQISAQIGPVVAVVPRSEASYSVETATHDMPVEVVLDASGRISGLMLRPAVPRNVPIDTLIAEMMAIAPDFALLVTRNGDILHAVSPDRPLAVGSAFKLGVLQALASEIDTGKRQWFDVVALDAADISLPSGTLQTWPVGSPLTLHTLASLMISISDNTATDALVRILGRDKVEDALGIAPVITTRELFGLKADTALAARYNAGNVAERREVLRDLASRPLPAASKVATPYDPEIEWNLSATKLCSLIESAADIDLMSINPGIANRSDWKRVTFKGGSEIGVLNFTTAVTGADGARYCIAATWNGPASIDDAAAATAYAGLLGKLARP